MSRIKAADLHKLLKMNNENKISFQKVVDELNIIANKKEYGNLKCSFCNRLNPCDGSYPEGCFHPESEYNL